MAAMALSAELRDGVSGLVARVVVAADAELRLVVALHTGNRALPHRHDVLVVAGRAQHDRLVVVDAEAGSLAIVGDELRHQRTRNNFAGSVNRAVPVVTTAGVSGGQPDREVVVVV